VTGGFVKTAFLQVTSFEGFRKDFVSSSFVQSSRVNQDYANKGGRPATLLRVAVGRSMRASVLQRKPRVAGVA